MVSSDMVAGRGADGSC